MVKLKRKKAPIFRGQTNKQIDKIFTNMPNIRKQAKEVTQTNLNNKKLKHKKRFEIMIEIKKVKK